MKSFKEFLFEDDVPTVKEEPVHGAHAHPKGTPAVNVRPVHGAHAQPKKDKLEEAAKPKESSYSWQQRHDNEHLGRTSDDVHKKLDMQETDFAEHPHSKDVFKYTKDSYEVNSELVNRSKGHTPDRRHDQHINNLDTALNHKPTEHNVYVYHGTSKWNPRNYLTDKSTKKIVRVPTYMSTSIDRSNATFFSGIDGGAEHHVIRIKVPKGSKGMYIGDNSSHKNEREFLLPRDTHLKFKSVRPTKTLETHEGNIHVWDAEVHHQPEHDSGQLNLPFKKKLHVQHDPNKTPTFPSRWNGGKKPA
jgi:hypothetical protein